MTAQRKCHVSLLAKPQSTAVNPKCTFPGAQCKQLCLVGSRGYILSPLKNETFLNMSLLSIIPNTSRI